MVESGKYRHYKGGVYEVLGCATHTETGEVLVVYTDEHSKLWCRPEKMFTEQINGVPRFVYIHHPSPSTSRTI